MNISNDQTSFQDRPRLYRQWLTLTLALALVALGATLTRHCALAYAPNFGSLHDDAIYAVCAKALASGHGYRILSLPMEPLQTKYPPLVATALSSIFRIFPAFPQNVLCLETLSCLFGIGFAWGAGAYLMASRRATSLLALSVIALTWLNLQFLSYLPITMADLPFAAASVLVLAASERAVRSRLLAGGEKKPVSRWIIIAAAFLVALLTHAMCNFLLAALIIYFLSLKQYRPLAILLTISWGIAVPYFLWADSHSIKAPPVMAYYTNYVLAAKEVCDHVGGPTAFVFSNLQSGCTEVIDTLIPAVKELQGTPGQLLLIVIYPLAWLAMVAGVCRELSRRGPTRLVALWLLVHTAGHLFWPRLAGQRHLLVVLPFAYYFLLTGPRMLGLCLKEPWQGLPHLLRSVQMSAYQLASALVAILFTIFLVTGNIVDDLHSAGIYAHRVPPPPNAGEDYLEAMEFHEAYDWIKAHSMNSDVIVWTNDPATYLWTGRKAIMSCLGEAWKMITTPWNFITKEDVLESIRLGHGSYLVIDPISIGGLSAFNQIGAAVEQIMSEHPGALTPVFTSHWGLITIFKINHSRLVSALPDPGSDHRQNPRGPR